MEKSPSEFGKALKKAIANIALNQDKNQQFIKHVLGVYLGRTGASAIQYWQKGHIPSSLEDIEKLAQALVRQKGITEKTQLLKFLASSGYPNFSKLCDQLFLEFSREESSFFVQTNRLDWGEAPTHSDFFGRTQEIQKAEKWISIDRCRIVTFLGIGGIGKTMFATKVAQQVSKQFDYVIWRSIREAPPLKAILDEFIRFLSNQDVNNLPNNVDTQIRWLLEYLHKYRCLLILDNLEAVMQVGQQAGNYQDGYDDYGHLIKVIGETTHNSCLILTSREKPKELALFDEDSPLVHCYTLSGLELEDLQTILKDKSIEGSENDWAETVQLYGGNPLALKVIAGTIQNLFNGKLADFLAEGGTVFGDIRNVLNEQFERLTFLEQTIMYWLAVERQATTIDTLHNNLIFPCSQADLLEAINSLQDRSLVEETPSGFTLQNVVMEYMTDHLVAKSVDEINDQRIEITPTIALAKATSREYIRENQLRLIVKPLADALRTSWGLQDVEKHLKERLRLLQKHYGQKPHYDAGNIINILNSLEIEINGYDFSGMAIREANLQNLNLENTDFSQAVFDRCSFTQNFGSIISIAFDPMGNYIASGTKTGEIMLLEFKTHKLIFKFIGHTDWVRALCFSDNGLELFSASDDQTVRMWDVRTGHPIKTFIGHNGRVSALAVDSEKQILVSAGDESIIKLWDISTGRCIRELKEQHNNRWIFSLKFSPDKNLLLSSGGDATIKLWRTDSYTCTKILEGHHSYVWSAIFSNDGSLVVSGSHDNTARIWRVKDGSTIQVIHVPDTQVRCVAINPQGDTLATAGNKDTVRIWDVKTGQPIKTLTGHQSILWAIAFSPNGDYLASGGDDLSMKIWSMQDLNNVYSYRGYNAGIGSVIFSSIHPDVLIASSDQSRLWNVQTGQSKNILKGKEKFSSAAIFNPAENMIACSATNGLIHLIDWKTGKTLRTIRLHSNFPITFTSDGQLLITGGGFISLWDMNTHSLVASLEAGIENYSLVFASKKRLLLVACERGSIQCWDIDRKERIMILRGHTSAIWSLALNEKTNQLISASSDKTVRVWDLEKMQQVAILEGHQDQVKGVVCSPDGRFIASCGYDKEVRIWDAQNFDCLHILQGHTDAVWKVSFNSNSRLLASGSRDETIRIWDTTTFECIKILKANRPYEKMNITKASGLNEIQKDNLLFLGAIDNERTDLNPNHV